MSALGDVKVDPKEGILFALEQAGGWGSAAIPYAQSGFEVARRAEDCRKRGGRWHAGRGGGFCSLPQKPAVNPAVGGPAVPPPQPEDASKARLKRTLVYVGLPVGGALLLLLLVLALRGAK